MKFLLIGIWYAGDDNEEGKIEVQTHHTDVEPKAYEAEHAAFALARHAEREDAPDRVLVIEDNRGPHTAYDWKLNYEYLQVEIDELYKKALYPGAQNTTAKDSQ